MTEVFLLEDGQLKQVSDKPFLLMYVEAAEGEVEVRGCSAGLDLTQKEGSALATVVNAKYRKAGKKENEDVETD